jgi:hypothetical protein
MDPKPETIRIAVGALTFHARLEHVAAPETCAMFLEMLPLRSRIIQARWSGESAWIPLGGSQRLVRENATSAPLPGQLLFYPGGVSETEILVPYGRTRFACREGTLDGNHFLTITAGVEQLGTLGELVLWHGAQDVSFELAG